MGPIDEPLLIAWINGNFADIHDVFISAGGWLVPEFFSVESWNLCNWVVVYFNFFCL